MARRILTIAMAMHTDYAGTWATIQAIRRQIREDAFARAQVQYLVLDNNPTSPQGEACRKCMCDKFSKEEPGHYMCLAGRSSTSLRNMLFQAADTEFVMVVDSHINISGLGKTLDFLKHCAWSSRDLFHGILQSENGGIVGTHMNPAFRGQNFGTWGISKAPDKKSWKDIDTPFEIPMHGMGLFLSRRDDWPGWHIALDQFGSEEGYTQEKFRLLGRKAYTLPFLTWDHRFGHPGGPAYKMSVASKYRNMLITFRELGLDPAPVEKYFAHWLKADDMKVIRGDVILLDIRPLPKPFPEYKPFLGYPIRINDEVANESEDYQAYETPLFV